jgi:transposase
LIIGFTATTFKNPNSCEQRYLERSKFKIYNSGYQKSFHPENVSDRISIDNFLGRRTDSVKMIFINVDCSHIVEKIIPGMKTLVNCEETERLRNLDLIAHTKVVIVTNP